MREEMEALGERIASMAAGIDVAMHHVLTDIRAFDAVGGWGYQGAMSCAHWLSWRVGWTLGTARDRVRVAQRLGELPLIDTALSKGEISYSKVRAMTRVATPENESVLLDYAHHSTAAQLETICRKYQMVQRLNDPDRDREAAYRKVTKRDLEDGMVRVEAVMRADEAAVVWAAIQQATKDASGKGTSKVDGLLAIIQAYVRGESPDRSPVEVIVTVPQDSLATGSAEPAAFAGGQVVSAETARRLACDCGVVEMVEGAAGEVLSVGRKTRSIPAAIKRALLVRDEHTCRFPGCSNRAFIDGHHIEHWALGGETRLRNLISLCTYHHGFVHEHGYRVDLDADQKPHFFDTRGREVEAVPPRPRRAWDGELFMDPAVNAPRWDGRPADYSLAVGALCRLDA